MSTEPLSDELIERISPLRGAFSDIRPVINYYRVTRENRLLFGSATALWSIRRTISPPEPHLTGGGLPYLRDVKIDFAWGGPMACSANLFPQIGTLRDHNVFTSGTPASASPVAHRVQNPRRRDQRRFRPLSPAEQHPHATIHGRDSLRLLLVTAGKLMHQTAGFWKGRS